MLTVLLNWCYIFIITFLLGIGFFRILEKFHKHNISFKCAHAVVCGVIISTVYAQFFSLIYKVGLIASLILWILCLFIYLWQKATIKTYLIQSFKALISYESALYLVIILFFAFFCSRGTFHSDTKLYHAQAIRWYEEYGVVKGLSNLQWHFAYNSSYFGFAALFSLSFLGKSLHCTTGFLAAVFCLWSFSHLKNFFKHKHHTADMCCIGILLYALVNLTGLMSPASDYATMFFVLYIIARWAEEIEKENGQNSVISYCLLSIVSVFTISLKLSAGLLVFLAIYPALILIKKKQLKSIILYIVLGIVAILPFLIRNVIISGWLLYPFPAIDLFNVDWKLPIQYVNIDSAQIKTWARCLYDPTLIDTPFIEWIPIWWNSQERYAQMLILTNIIAVGLDIAILIHSIVSKKNLNWNLILLNAVCIICAISWFLLAAFIRYGLAFLIAIPMLSVGMWIQNIWDSNYIPKSSFYKLLSGFMVTLMFFILIPYLDHYFTDDIVFIKQHLTDNYYLYQKDYEYYEMQEYSMNGTVIYNPKEGESTGYQYFPASSYDYMINCTELRTSNIKDGFRNTEFK